MIGTRNSRLAVMLASCVLIGVSEAAAGAVRVVRPSEPAQSATTSRRHGVRRPDEVSLMGRVYDAQRDEPVVRATITVGDRATTSDNEGRYALNGIENGTITLTASRWGFEAAELEIDVHPGANTADIPMISLPEVVITTSTSTIRLDYDSTRFGYILAFVGAVMNPALDICTNDGTLRTLEKHEIARLDGPSVRTAAGACCSSATAEKVRVTLESGDAFDALLPTSCPPYDMWVSGLDKVSTSGHYVRFTDAISIAFP